MGLSVLNLAVCASLFLAACAGIDRIPSQQAAQTEAQNQQAVQLELPLNLYPQIFSEIEKERQAEGPKRHTSKSLGEIESDRVRVLQELQAPDFKSPSKHTRLLPPKGYPGYSDLQITVSHPYYEKGQLTFPGDLVAEWINFFKRAQKRIVVNVFEFDLKEVADVLIEKRKAGLEVRVGMDDKSIGKLLNNRKVVRAKGDKSGISTADYLRAGGVDVFPVDSVGLNHQKVAAIDWGTPENAWVLFSSGNLTRSCLDRDGDLAGFSDRPNTSVPNANHVIWMKSFVLANLVNFELSKTLRHSGALRGSQYPTTGSYQVTGPGVNPQTLEAYPSPSLVISFSPGGALRNINKNLVADLIENTSGPLRILQFAFASPEVGTAVLNRAQLEFQERKTFDFIGVGDTPFAMEKWSQFLRMSALKKVVGPDKVKRYFEDTDGDFYKAFNADQLTQIRDKVFIAPRVYGMYHSKIRGRNYESNAKLHHKIVASGDYAILATSFNLSASAENNNEQILIFKDPYLIDAVDGMARYLSESSKTTVYQEYLRRAKNFKAYSDETKNESDVRD